MKQDRHTAIRELVAGAPIGSQDELRRRLVKRGFEVTQATLSRDIHELHLYKGPNGYAVPNGVGLETKMMTCRRPPRCCAASGCE